jgi:hypothetical protein
MKRGWKIWLLLGLTVMIAAVVLRLPRIGQTSGYHDFADHRMLWGIQNCWNVLSNLPFLVVGVVGLLTVWKARVAAPVAWMYGVLFMGVLLTGFGSAYYHWHPDNDTLVWDRFPMTLVFMSLLAATVAELVSRRLGTVLFVPLLVTGIGSVLWWHYTEVRGQGDLRLYGLVQFYPVLFIPLLLWLFYDPAYRPAIRSLAWVVVWYVVAKAVEALDKPIYGAIGVSGHTLKHLAAAVSTGYLVQMFGRKYGRTGLEGKAGNIKSRYMLLKENPTKEDLLRILDGLRIFGRENLDRLLPDLNRHDDEAVYLIGLLERATVFSDDLFNIIRYSDTGRYMSVYILGRCIMDDFITLANVRAAADRREEIHRIQAYALRQNFQKLQGLLELNTQVFEGKFPYYPTAELIDDVKEKFLHRGDLDRYILNAATATPDNMEFKAHRTLKQMAEAAGSATNDTVGRAYYFWRQWSDLVHFSPFAYNLAVENDFDTATLYKNLQELTTYIYRIMQPVFAIFIQEKDYKPVDSQNFVRTFNQV